MNNTLPAAPLQIVITDGGREVIALRALLTNLMHASYGLLHATNNAQYGSSKEWQEAFTAHETAEAFLYPAFESCPECGHPLNEEVCPFSECDTCEQRTAEENRDNARPFDTSPASPLAFRLANDLHAERRTD